MTTTKILISIPDGFLKELDSFSKEIYETRSSVIRQALREYIREHKKVKKLV